ncbi:MAG TPA: TonB-dependent receptor [Bryobacteraceae bacterium]|nr:TonB-dependent receptor [Bryobacteraceae bacterium]
MWRCVVSLILCAWFASPQQGPFSFQGRVRDAKGRAIRAATVHLTLDSGESLTVGTDRAGAFTFQSLRAGQYSIRAEAPSFVAYTEAGITLPQLKSLDIVLDVAAPKAHVTVVGRRLNVEPDNNASIIQLRTPHVRGLPDFPGDFESALRAFAGASALGFTGPQIFVNNLTRNWLPPKTAIREVHINQAPFSAQYDRPGFNRIEVFTREGAPKFHAETYFSVSDARLNARDPFAADRRPHQLRLSGATVEGPIVPKRLFFFAALERTDADSSALVDATVLDDAWNAVPFRGLHKTPERRTAPSVRLDHHLGQNNLLSLRYDRLEHTGRRHSQDKLALPETGYRTSEKNNGLQVRHTATLSPEVVNEIRFQYEWSRKWQTVDRQGPAIRVAESFTAGGASAGFASRDTDRWEFQNYLVATRGGHAVRFGVRLRHASLSDISAENLNGTYTFDGGDNAGTPINGMERYRRTIMLQAGGLPPDQVRALGGGATKLALTVGPPLARIKQLDLGVFAHDDWRFHPRLTFSYGARLETQTNLRRSRDLAPRFAIAWMPGRGDPEEARFVVRAGFGLFYDRVTEQAVLESARGGNGRRQVFEITDPTLLNAFPALPSFATGAWPDPQIVTRRTGDLQAPVTLQTMLSIERQLPARTTVSVNATDAQTWHGLRARVFRDLAEGGSVVQLHSDARLKERRLAVDVSHQTGNVIALTTNYVVSRISGDSDGPDTVVYDLRHDYGRTVKEVRHNVTMTGAFRAPGGFGISPFVVASSGRPFNIYLSDPAPGGITIPVRPSWATGPDAPGAIATRFGYFEPNHVPGQPPIPRNLGSGPGFLSINIKLAKTFALAGETREARNGGSGAEEKARLTFAVQALNLLNRVNAGGPTGDLRSPQFGQSTALAEGFNFGGNPPVANRRLEGQVRLQF